MNIFFADEGRFVVSSPGERPQKKGNIFLPNHIAAAVAAVDSKRQEEGVALANLKTIPKRIPLAVASRWPTEYFFSRY